MQHPADAHKCTYYSIVLQTLQKGLYENIERERKEKAEMLSRSPPPLDDNGKERPLDCTVLLLTGLW